MTATCGRVMQSCFCPGSVAPRWVRSGRSRESPVTSTSPLGPESAVSRCDQPHHSRRSARIRSQQFSSFFFFFSSPPSAPPPPTPQPLIRSLVSRRTNSSPRAKCQRRPLDSILRHPMRNAALRPPRRLTAPGVIYPRPMMANIGRGASLGTDGDQRRPNPN